MNRPGAAVLGILLLGLLCWCAPLLAAAPGPGERVVRVEGPGGPVILPVLERDGKRYVSLRALSLALGRQAERDPRGDWRIEAENGTTVRFPAALPGIAWAGTRIVSLGGDARREGEDLLVPVPGLDRLVRALAPGARVAGAGDGGEGKPGVRVLLLGRGPGKIDVRVEFPPPARSVLLRRGTDGSAWLQVAGIDPGPLPWSHREIGGTLVEALDLRSRAGGLELVVRPGPGLRSVTLDRDPEGGRAVLHLAGREPARGAGDLGRQWLGGLDPGRGGEEERAVGPITGVLEKDVVLDVARRAAAILRSVGFEVELTRDGDENVSLDDRAALANRLHADLFISIHANASRAPGAHGAETYILAREATDDAARATAALENDAGGVLSGAGGREDVGLILWDLAQAEYLAESARLAEAIENRLDAELGLEDRGVKQAPFRVLVGATCPAVLVELGFLTNPREERLLATAAYRRRLARVLADAVIDFRKQARAGGGEALSP